MSKIYSGSFHHTLEAGSPMSTTRRSPIWRSRRGTGWTIYEGPSLGTKLAAAPFLVGDYPHIRLVPHPKARAMKDDRPKLIVTEETKVEERELLEMSWMDGGRRVVQKLEPGEWDARNFKDFRNDIIEKLKVPPNASVTLYDDSDEGGNHIELTRSGEYSLDDYGLKRRVSSVTFELDSWKEIRRDLGRTMSKDEQGDPIIIRTHLAGFPGTYSEQNIDFQESESESTNWHLSQSITATVKIGGENATVSTEFSTTTEAGRRRREGQRRLPVVRVEGGRDASPCAGGERGGSQLPVAGGDYVDGPEIPREAGDHPGASQ